MVKNGGKKKGWQIEGTKEQRRDSKSKGLGQEIYFATEKEHLSRQVAKKGDSTEERESTGAERERESQCRGSLR